MLIISFDSLRTTLICINSLWRHWRGGGEKWNGRKSLRNEDAPLIADTPQSSCSDWAPIISIRFGNLRKLWLPNPISVHSATKVVSSCRTQFRTFFLFFTEIGFGNQIFEDAEPNFCEFGNQSFLKLPNPISDFFFLHFGQFKLIRLDTDAIKLMI